MLVDLRRRRQDQFPDLGLDTGVEHVDHTLDADVEDQFGLFVEEFGAVDKSQVVDGLDAPCRLLYGICIADVARDPLEIIGDVVEAGGRAA